MKPRAMTEAELETQIVALWNGRPRPQRTSEHVIPFYNWLVDYAPWLIPGSSVSVERVRELVEPHTTSADASADAFARHQNRRDHSTK